MRVVADNSTVVSGLLWNGPSRQILDAARNGIVQLFTSPDLLDELDEVLRRDKFIQRLAMVGTTSRLLVVGYAALTNVTRPQQTPAVIADDPDDDAVLACAIAADAEVIVSGDHHLLELGNYQNMPIISAVQLLARLANKLEME